MKQVLFSFFVCILLLPGLTFAAPSSREDSLNAGAGSGSAAGDAAIAANQSGVSVKNPLSAGSITELFQAIIDVIMVFAVPVIVFFIIYAGFLYVTARGDTGKIQKAHMALLYAVIGGVIIIGANVLIDVVAGTVNSFN